MGLVLVADVFAVVVAVVVTSCRLNTVLVKLRL